MGVLVLVVLRDVVFMIVDCWHYVSQDNIKFYHYVVVYWQEYLSPSTFIKWSVF